MKTILCLNKYGKQNFSPFTQSKSFLIDMYLKLDHGHLHTSGRCQLSDIPFEHRSIKQARQAFFTSFPGTLLAPSIKKKRLYT